MRKFRIPARVGETTWATEDLSDAIYARIRSCQHAPVHIFIRGEDVYALSERHAAFRVWAVTYLNDHIATFTRMHRPHQILAHLERAMAYRSSLQMVG